MSKKSDNGFATNVANFSILLSRVTAMGTGYQPANANCAVTAMQTLLTAAQTSLSDMVTAIAVQKKAVDDRITVFADVRAFGTRIVNAFQTLVKDKEAVNTLIDANKKLQGTRIGKKIKGQNVGADGAENSVSASQQSYSYLIQHLMQICDLISQQPNYKPNEADLKVAAVQQKIKDLQAAYDVFVEKQTIVMSKRKDRNNIHFYPETGIRSVAADVKKYVRATFGTQSPEFKQIKGLKFLAPVTTRKRRITEDDHKTGRRRTRTMNKANNMETTD